MLSSPEASPLVCPPPLRFAVLMNLLIAMRGSTYAAVMVNALSEWRYQRADTILLAEQTPWLLAPLPWVSKKDRPASHVEAPIKIVSSKGKIEERMTFYKVRTTRR